MKKEALYWLILTIVAALAATIVYTTYRDSRPCVEPIPYAIGNIDPRFNLSTEAARTSAEAATAIWEETINRDLFVYDPEAEFKINLIYDEREALAKLGLQIAAQQDTEDTVRENLEAAQARFDALQEAYNQKVEEINATGGATPSEAKELARERSALEALAASINVQVQTYNARVAARNAIIEEYNQNAGKTYEEGQYVRDRAGERINIFVFLDRPQLTRVLAHEFGHAIGLEHNDDQKSIMYAKNESGNLKPSTTDLAELAALCGA